MKRPSWQELFIKIALEVSTRSTCTRLKVGAVLVKDTRIISMGYNGVTKGSKHCYDHFKDYHKNYYMSREEYLKTDEFKDDHRQFSIRREVHGEINAILFAAKSGVKTNGAEMYVTISPCIDCAKALVTAGISKVYYYEKYDRDTSGIEFLKENNIPCVQVSL